MADKTDKQYQVLARKWRPQTFDMIVGQDAVVKTLQNAIKSNRLAHAYLFSGSRGIGKTSIARIFAKALNCENGPAAEPCNECANCREISSGISQDVIEIDAASNRGIDDIRSLREHVKYMPSTSRLKIYIIDEVHMVTKEGFNALLKTLEEPPAHVKFFFATTEPHKIPETIISRCQRFDLKRITPDDITGRLREIADAESISVPEEALNMVSRAADGAMRDGESLFDQIISCCDKNISCADVADILGLVSNDVFFTLDDAIINNNMASAIDIAQTVIHSGKDTVRFIEDLVRHFRDLLVARTAPNAEALLTGSADSVKRVIETAPQFSSDNLLNILDILTKAQENMRYAISREILLEVTIIKLVRSRELISLNDIISRLEQLRENSEGMVAETPKKKVPSLSTPAPIAQPAAQETVQEAVSVQEEAPTYTSEPEPIEQPQPEPAVAEPEPAPAPVTESPVLDNPQKIWNTVTQALGNKKVRLRNVLQSCQCTGYNNSVMTIEVTNNFYYKRIQDNQKILEKALSDYVGAPISIHLVLSDKPAASAANHLAQHPMVTKAKEMFNGTIINTRS